MYRLLIVEDEFFSRQALQYSVESCYPDQFEIHTTDNGLEALDLCQQKHPDIVLVDLNIPGISGLSLIQTLNDYDFSGKIIITTAHNRANYIREALSLGVISYLLKPIRPLELKTEIDKCLTLIKQQRESENTTFDSLFSYAQSYLIHDILSCKAPQKLLTDVYGWSENGSLRAGFLMWCPEKKTSNEEKCDFLNEAARLFAPGFLLLSAALHGNVLIFLHGKSSVPTEQLSLLLSFCLNTLRRTFPQGSLFMSELSNTYSDLYTAIKKLLFLSEHERNLFLPPQKPKQVWWPEEEYLRLRQKFVQRLKQQQNAQLIQYLKRKTEQEKDAWAWFSLFLEAFQSYDDKTDPLPLLKIFQSQNWTALLEHWLTDYYTAQSVTFEPVTKSQQAIAIIHAQFSQDLTQEAMATRLGLTPTYFSSLFKKETGKTFPQYLSEFRMEHARRRIDEGERNIDKLALECGIYSKKYFLELFKRYSGCSFSQYICQKEDSRP